MKISTLIVDDEAPARARLVRLLAAHPDIEIVGEAAGGEAAVLAIEELRPALLFLDVQLPPPDGISVLQALHGGWQPCTVFVTAHAEYAVKAFDLHAVDYLLKPYSPARLAEALDRVRKHLQTTGTTAGGAHTGTAAEKKSVPAPLERFLVKNNGRYVVVRVADIEWVEAAANYVVLHTPQGNHVLRRSLAVIETELDPRRFFRLNRSALVSLATIREVQTVNSGEHLALLQSGARLPVTRGLRELQDRLESTA